ncbi:NmrA family NAD(P)-binding protein [Microdochium nivale]|nr:NmrA family NAD(P)-binding protein [Microdochium nivale]
MKVAILGATGKTGQSIVDALLESEIEFEITALTRSTSLDKPETQNLRNRGVKTVAVDLSSLPASPTSHGGKPAAADPGLVRLLTSIDVVISTTFFMNLGEQVPLVDAAKAAGVARFIPCNFQTVAPRGVMALSDAKYAILDHIQRVRQPYTVIEVGWWYQLSLPRVPSGRLNGNLERELTGTGTSNTRSLIYLPAGEVIAGGRVPSAMTDLRDVGRFVALIVADDRTVNKTVFAWGEVATQTEVGEMVERLAGEAPAWTELSADALDARIAQLPAEQQHGVNFSLVSPEYQRSWGARGDNTPENAKYLGFLSARELYPDFKPISLEGFVREALEAGATAAK